MKWSSAPADTIVTHGLGSCLGIALYDPLARIGGLLHVMMPSSAANPQKALANPFMFVDTAIPAFFRALAAAGAIPARCQVKVAGGAVVSGNDFFETGKRNYVALKKALWKAGVLVTSEDVGGQMARTMYLSVGDGVVRLSRNGEMLEL